jgi:hypothetical protein
MNSYANSNGNRSGSANRIESQELSPPGDGAAVIQVLDARGRVTNVNVDLATHRDQLFPQAQGVSVPRIQCTTGQANIDNVCVCGASVNSSPFVPYSAQYTAQYTDRLFAPQAEIGYATPAARSVADRMMMPVRQ